MVSQPPHPVAQVVIQLLSDGTVHVGGRLPGNRAHFLMMLEEAKEHYLQAVYRKPPTQGPGIEVPSPEVQQVLVG